MHSSGKAWLAPDSIRGARSGPNPCSHLAVTSTGIQKQLPLLETAQHKNTMHDKRVVGNQGPDLALLLCFHQDQGPCPIGKGSTHDHRPVGKEHFPRSRHREGNPGQDQQDRARMGLLLCYLSREFAFSEFLFLPAANP